MLAHSTSWCIKPEDMHQLRLWEGSFRKCLTDNLCFLVALLSKQCPKIFLQDRVLSDAAVTTLTWAIGFLFTNALMMPELMLHVIYRAARYCHAAAHGGQITAPYSLVHQVVRVWTGDPKMTAADADMGSEPRRVQVQ